MLVARPRLHSCSEVIISKSEHYPIVFVACTNLYLLSLTRVIRLEFGISSAMFRARKLECWCYQVVKNYSDKWSNFDAGYGCDRQTDRQNTQSVALYSSEVQTII